MMAMSSGQASGKVPYLSSMASLVRLCSTPQLPHCTALGNAKGWHQFPSISWFLNAVFGHLHSFFVLCLSIPADIVKMIESQPELESQLRRVRGGYLKIQGTWMPYEVCSHFLS